MDSSLRTVNTGRTRKDTGRWLSECCFSAGPDDQEASRSLSRWWSEVQAPTPPPHVPALGMDVWRVSAPHSHRAYCFQVPREAHFQDWIFCLVLLSHQDPALHPLLRACTPHAHTTITSILFKPMSKPLSPCIILVRLHLYEKAFIFKWFFFCCFFFKSLL